MTKAVATEYGSYNIRVNSVQPGFIKTPMMAGAAGEEGRDALSQIPMVDLPNQVKYQTLCYS